MAARYLFPALAVAGRAIAQSSCSNSATTTIQSQGDASALASCQTFSGSIAIATGTAGQIALDGIQTITGDLVANNVSEITQISSSSLSTIGGSFNLNTLQLLSSLNFPRLSQVGSIDWIALAALQGLSFTTGVQQAGTVNIQNTQLNTLDGINLQTVDTFYIANNNYLNQITMQLGNITQAATIQANGRNVSVTFPNLIWAFNITLNNASSVTMPSLSAINGSLGFQANYFSDLELANLTSVGQSFSIIANSNLNNLSFPELKTVGGGLTVANNSQLQSIQGFPALQTVGGAVIVNGAVSNFSLPSIQDIRGAFNLTSTQDDSSSCSQFKSLSGNNNVIKGTFTCSGSKTSSGGSGGASGTSTGSGSGSSSTKSSSANPVYISGATGVLGVVAAIFGML